MHLPLPRRRPLVGAPRTTVSALLALLVGGLIAPGVHAGASSASGQAQVNASVINSCVVTSVSGLAFGTTYNPVQSAGQVTQLTGQVNLTCTQGTQGWVALDQGQNAAADSTCTTPDRRMYSGGTAAYLAYALYYNTSGSPAIWGCVSASAPTFTAVSSKTSLALTAIAQIPAGQDVPPGTYADQVMVTVNF
jgi:spore coat protein U-like protein